MRTKTLLLTAALSAAGVATSMAQVFSVNAVGYVTKTVPANGFALISNPLTASDNSIKALFAGVPEGTQVYKYSGTAFKTATFTFGEFGPADAAALTVVPGEGVFVRNPTAQPMNITFVGEVPQGTLSNPLPVGLSIRSSMVPQEGTAAELGLKGGEGDQIFQFNATTQKYATSTFTFGDWGPALGKLAVGEAVFIKKVAAGTWDRTFSVNTP